MRSRKHLTEPEVSLLLNATKGGRNEERDRCLILLSFRHGLRVSEACGLQLAQVDVDALTIHVSRRKRGLSTAQPLQVDEISAIKAWLAKRANLAPDCSSFFVSERRKPLDRRTAWLAVRKYGQAAGLDLPAHPHMLRHACGFALADQGVDTRVIQDYLGHRCIQHTAVYTASNSTPFGRLWQK